MASLRLVLACVAAAAAPCEAFAATRAALPRLSRRHGATPTMSADGSKVYRRAEFWEDEQCTLLEIANVIGRWESSEQWSTRTAFSIVDDQRAETMAQGASRSRFEMAQRNGLVERVALQQNAAGLPFTDAKLAAAFGKSVAEMDAMPVTSAAINVVYDALAESKSSLLPSATVDKRRAGWLDEAGGIDEGALQFGMLKSRLIVCVSWVFFGKGQLYGLLVGGKVALDATDAFDKLPPELVPYADYIYWGLTFAVAAFAIQSSRTVASTTVDYETVSADDADGGEAYQTEIKKRKGYSGGVLEKWNKALVGEKDAPGE